MPGKKTCENCVHYRPPVIEWTKTHGLGLCMQTQLSGMYPLRPNRITALDAEVYVGPHFGCIHFHKKHTPPDGTNNQTPPTK